jgi:acetyl esterase/lipase
MKQASKLLVISSILALCLGVSSLGAETEAETEKEADILFDVPFVDDGEDYHLLDLFGTRSSEEKLPTVIEVHGGGFIGGNKDSNIDHCLFYAENRFSVVSVDYRTVPKEGDFKGAVQDLFAAYHWVSDHADEYHFDLEHVFFSGDSAGGYYCLLTNAIWHSEELRDYFGLTLPPYTPLGYALTAPATDMLANKDKADGEGPDAHVAKVLLEGGAFEDEELMEHMDLYTAVEPEAFAGIYMLSSTEDTTTREDTLKFDQYLTEEGVDHTFVDYESEGSRLIHVFNISNPEYPESLKANQGLVDYMRSLME